jgi:ubiquinone/menaquinone biosynthesis C-methylase UbiE
LNFAGPTTYNPASDFFDHPTNTFWDQFGQAELDVCCGSGASAIPAADYVGEEGKVLGADLAENLLELARTEANRRGLRQVEFRRGDMMALEPTHALYDAVVCVFGIFFGPDMPAAVRELW